MDNHDEPLRPRGPTRVCKSIMPNSIESSMTISNTELPLVFSAVDDIGSLVVFFNTGKTAKHGIAYSIRSREVSKFNRIFELGCGLGRK
jgi:hypothetical protein